MKHLSCKQTLKPIQANKLPPLWAMEQYFNFYLNELKPLVSEVATQSKNGAHGLDTHTNAVVFRGIDYAIHIGKDPLPVVFACALHDAARINDAIDFEHGKNAVPMAMKIVKNFPKLFSNETYLSILSAIMNHTTGTVARDYIAACLWDADRTRLSWWSGFDAKFFNTQRGAFVASSSPKQYLDFQQNIFPHLIWSKEY